MVQKGVYIHFKGGRYVVMDEATHTETGEELVIYEAVNPGRGLRKTWARPATMFQDEVEHEGKKVPRFRLLP